MHVEAASAEIQRLAAKMNLSEADAAELLAKSLPDGWVACRTNVGEVYYHSTITGASQWTHPNVPWEAWQPDSQQALDSIKCASDNHPRRKAMLRMRSQNLRYERRTGGHSSAKEAKEIPLQHSVYDARSRHVPLITPPSLFSDTATNAVREDLQGKAFAVHGLLCADEACSYTSAADASGFKDSDVGREFTAEMRNNSRLIHFSEALASALWYRMKPLLMHKDIYLMQPMGFCAEGRWKPVGVNPCFRISRYQKGEQFAAHRDGMYVNEDGESSVYSLVLYLNDDFEGGELKFFGQATPYVFKPRAGSAVLFPHDMLHEAAAVTAGTKYVARTEIMFRCVQATPLPSQPDIVDDPLFQKMAALYEQIGDLVRLGDPIQITEAYQEALGIQIAHKGTFVPAPVSASVMPLPESLLARSLTFLSADAIVATAPVHSEWQSATQLGILWRDFYQRRWPLACPLVEDRARQLDPELKDWHGLFRQAHRIEEHSACSTVFLSDFIHAQLAGDSPVKAVHAEARHEEIGFGWDVSFRQRAGWSIGQNNRRHRYSRGQKKSAWLQGREINWPVFAELFRWAFTEMDVLPSETRLLIPVLPGVWTKSVRARASRILTGRFEVPALYLVPAPFCALVAHGFTTGMVVWNCEVGQSVVCCYKEGVEMTSNPFNPGSATAAHLALIMCKMAASLGTEDCEVLSNIIVSSQRVSQADSSNATGSAKVQDDHEGYMQQKVAKFQDCENNVPEVPPSNKFRLSASEIKKELLQILGQHASEHQISESLRKVLEDASFVEADHQHQDVIAGASCLHAAPCLQNYEVQPEERASWEWRWFVDGCWMKVPTYAAGVFEQAFRNGAQNASAELEQSILFADLEKFLVRTLDGEDSYKLTRFLRGRPSANPDLRTPEDMDRQDAVDDAVVIEEVTDASAVHARTMAGRVVFSASKAASQALTVQDLLEDIACKMDVPCRRIRLLDSNGSDLDALIFQEALEADGDLDILALLSEDVQTESPSHEHGDEPIPEDWPGEYQEWRS